MTNVYIDDIIELHTHNMRYPTYGKVVCLNPIKCKLQCGAIYTVGNDEIVQMNKSLQEQFRGDFKNEFEY